MFVKGYELLSFAKNIGKNIGKKYKQKLSRKYSQKLLNYAKQSATDTFKTDSKRAIQKTAKATCDLTGNKTAGRITKISKNSPQNNSETITSEHDQEIPKKDMYLQTKDRKLLMI